MKTDLSIATVAAQMELAQQVLCLTHQQMIALGRERQLVLTLCSDPLIKREEFAIEINYQISLECHFYSPLDGMLRDVCQYSVLYLEHEADATPYFAWCEQFRPTPLEYQWLVPETSVLITHYVLRDGNCKFVFVRNGDPESRA
ncbi:MAG: hypothetical protein LIP08_13285 [Bacteroides sp.]|nr:hypothetical protein [Bacteroides sp.]